MKNSLRHPLTPPPDARSTPRPAPSSSRPTLLLFPAWPIAGAFVPPGSSGWPLSFNSHPIACRSPVLSASVLAPRTAFLTMHAHDLAHLSAVIAAHGEQLTAASRETIDQML